MKQKTKRLLKFALLIFAVSFLMTNCEKDDDLIKEEPSSKQNIPSKYLLPIIVFENEINQNKTLKQALHNLKEKGSEGENNTSSKLIFNDSLNIAIEDSSAKFLETPDGSYHSYTFVAFDYDHPDGLQNVVLSLQPDGTYKEILIRYELTDSEIELFRNNEYVDLDGKISFAMLDDNSFVGNLFSKQTADNNCVHVDYDDSGANCKGELQHPWSERHLCPLYPGPDGPSPGTITSFNIDTNCADTSGGFDHDTGFDNSDSNNDNSTGTVSNGPLSGAGGPNSQQDASPGYAPTPQQERESDFIKKLIANNSSACFVSLTPDQQSDIFNFLENGLGSIDIYGNVLNGNPTPI